MSHIDPDLFKPRNSELLANMAKDCLDDLGLPHLKSKIDNAMHPSASTPESSLMNAIKDELKKGLI